MNPSGQECYSIERISENVQCIRETDEWDCRPLMYLIVGDEKALLIDTGCGSGDLNKFIRSSGVISEKQKLIVLNTHNHPEQTGGNWSFSSAGKMGLSHNVENLCASGADKNYTKLRCEHYDWQVKAFKITRWLADEETILLGDSSELRNVVKVMHAPGHTPDSMILWFVGLAYISQKVACGKKVQRLLVGTTF
ncbi:unnamed protein product [Toxocara canis]|uniref:Lactamase_B domain-containing protein n=1 Tax=Toxocara canis TaxID=6265 RepID=A0A183TXV6_TOXCA|nr:unnamed protein product [Toxocara canis]